MSDQRLVIQPGGRYGFEGHPDAWVELPERWLVEHDTRRMDAQEAAEKAGLRGAALNFAIAIKLAADWRVPGLEGPPEKWDFSQLDMGLIKTFNSIVFTSFNNCAVVPKVLSLPSSEAPAAAATESTDGASTETP